MPFLRSVVALAAQDDAGIELRSSKTLIGAGASTCDVVLPDQSGVLEVHALLSLSPTKSSGNLVPFSAAAGGACYLNGREMPQEGVRVVHGDRIAFGGPEANAFVFELTGRASRASVSNSTQRSSTRDASSDSALSEYIEKKLRQRQQQRQSQSLATISGSDSVLLREGRSMMEPPPSLLSSMSESVASTSASPLKDSILERSAAPMNKSLSSSSAFKSTAEKNYAEIEKLRLSQRMRQVNRLLNGDLAFGESYMAEEDSILGGVPRRRTGQRDEEEDGVVLGNSRSQTRRRDSGKRLSNKSAVFNQQETGNEDEDEDDDDDDDELPAMMEKPSPMTSLRQSVTISDQGAAPKERQHELKASLVLGQLHESSNGLLSTGDTNQGKAALHPYDEEDDIEEDSLADSLPGFSEPMREPAASPPSPRTRPSGAPRTSVNEAARATNDGSVIGSEPSATAPRPKTALHQKLIDQAIRQRRLEALAQTFVRWQRGLRVQTQRRLWKAQQLRKVSSRLAILRRDRAFATWKRVADIQDQVVSCRLDAFQSRSAARSVRNAWTAWWRFFLTGRRAKLALRAAVVQLIHRQVRSAFRKWEECSREQGNEAKERMLQRQYENQTDARLNHTAQWHRDRNARERQRRVLLQWRQIARESSQTEKRLVHTARQLFDRVSRERLRRVLADWRRVASKQIRRCCVIQRLLHRQAGQRLARALALWRLASLRAREEERITQEQARAVDEKKRELEQLNEQHKPAQMELDAASSEKLRVLEDAIKQKDEAMKAMEAQLDNLHDMKRQIKEKDAAIKSMEAQLKERRRQKVWLLPCSLPSDSAVAHVVYAFVPRCSFRRRRRRSGPTT